MGIMNMLPRGLSPKVAFLPRKTATNLAKTGWIRHEVGRGGKGDGRGGGGTSVVERMGYDFILFFYLVSLRGIPSF